MTNLSVSDGRTGHPEKALGKTQAALRIDPSGLSYMNLAFAYLSLNRLPETQAVIQEAQSKNLDSTFLRLAAYFVAFLQNDPAGMAKQVEWSKGKPGEDFFLGVEADTAAYSGQDRKALSFTQQALTVAKQANEGNEALAGGEVDFALQAALVGNTSLAQQHAFAALALSTGRDVQYQAALALALVGNAAKAQSLTDDLAKRFPQDTLAQYIEMPQLRAELALLHHDTAKAVELLEPSRPYDLGGSLGLLLYTVYVRGLVFLAAKQGNAAAAEFQKIINNRGLVLIEPIGALAHLGLARAYTLEAQSAPGSAADAARANARKTYQDFLDLWKNADPDIPIFQQAKAEYAKLK